MKRNLKILGLLIIIFALEIYFSIISNAAIETKADTFTLLSTQMNAFQLCYDMRNPTSSLGNNSLDPHLELNKDYGAWAYLGMSAYGTNTTRYDIDMTYVSSTINNTGVIRKKENYGREISSGIIDLKNETEIVKKYGNTKYLEVFNSTDFNNNNKGMAIKEIDGWYTTNMPIFSDKTMIVHFSQGTQARYIYYGTAPMGTTETSNFRPVIWN